VRLQCRAEGYPENITYRWYRNDVDVQLIPGLMQVGSAHCKLFMAGAWLVALCLCLCVMNYTI